MYVQIRAAITDQLGEYARTEHRDAKEAAIRARYGAKAAKKT